MEKRTEDGERENKGIKKGRLNDRQKEGWGRKNGRNGEVRV